VYEFDSRANLLNKRWLHADFLPSLTTVLSSGKTIALRGHGTSSEDMKYDGAVLDENGHVIERFDLPLPPGGGGWTFASHRMAAGEGLPSQFCNRKPHRLGRRRPLRLSPRLGSSTSESFLCLRTTTSAIHNQCVFGPGVAVEVYHMVGERMTFHFEEYDLKTGEKVASRVAHISGGAFGCYTGTEVSMLAPSAHVDPVRGLSEDTLRLLISKLQ
jgi:hypothetical protein